MNEQRSARRNTTRQPYRYPHTRVTVRRAAAVVTAALVFAACGNSTKGASPATTAAHGNSSGTRAASGATGTVGVTPTTITLGQIADVSGAIPGLFSGAVNGLGAWAAYVNSTGGINGRKIVVDFHDSALSCNAYTSAIHTIVNSDFAMVGSSSAADACGLPTLKANPQIPVIQAITVDTALYNDANVYSPNPGPPGSPTTGYSWVKNKYGAAAVAKTAALYPAQTLPAYQGESAAAKSVGYHYLYSRGVGQSETNFTSDILRMKDAGVRIVDLNDFPVNDVADFLQQAAQQSFRPEAVINTTAYDSSFFKLLGNPADAAHVVMPLTYAMYLGQDNATVPEIATMTTWLRKTHPNAPVNLYSLEGWATGRLFQQAMSKVRGTPTRSALLAALNGVSSFNANGLLAPSGPGKKKPSECIVVAGIKNGGYARIDPAGTGFECRNAGYFYLPHAAA